MRRRISGPTRFLANTSTGPPIKKCCRKSGSGCPPPRSGTARGLLLRTRILPAAAECYKNANRTDRAEEALALAQYQKKDYEGAAALLLKHGRAREAAVCFESIGRWREAQDLWERLGSPPAPSTAASGATNRAASSTARPKNGWSVGRWSARRRTGRSPAITVVWPLTTRRGTSGSRPRPLMKGGRAAFRGGRLPEGRPHRPGGGPFSSRRRLRRGRSAVQKAQTHQAALGVLHRPKRFFTRPGCSAKKRGGSRRRSTISGPSPPGRRKPQAARSRPQKPSAYRARGSNPPCAGRRWRFTTARPPSFPSASSMIWRSRIIATQVTWRRRPTAAWPGATAWQPRACTKTAATRQVERGSKS